ncbi:hypothetical protein RRG08_049845 [Elysia crispata]|uniref:Uncharacterized protein n=1 Tax=Elysia crispata TaxID=231223 RepID=A0AAE1DM07_9GAST|nr:hypothetical protein RRG08_049845 [Elysia crispata]
MRKRQDACKLTLHSSFIKLCITPVASHGLLFGDDLQKQLREISETKQSLPFPSHVPKNSMSTLSQPDIGGKEGVVWRGATAIQRISHKPTEEPLPFQGRLRGQIPKRENFHLGEIEPARAQSRPQKH